MLNRFSLGMAIFMFAAFAFQVSAQIQPTSSGSVSVANQVNFSVFVTLYKDGKAIRTTELRTDGTSYYVTWNDVPIGALEVHFEAKGYGKVIKRIVVVKDGQVRVELNSMDKNDEVWGAGPSLFDLQKRIETLETANTALKSEVTALKADIAALKKGH